MSMGRALTCLLALACLFSACASPRVDRTTAVEDRSQLVRFEGFMKTSSSTSWISKTPWWAILSPQVRAGSFWSEIQLRRSVAGFLQIFRDEFNLDSRPIDFDLFGVGVGVNAAPVLGDLGPSVPVSIPLKAGMNIALGGDDGLHGTSSFATPT